MAENEKPAAPTSEPIFKAQVFGPDAEEHRGSQQLTQTSQEARQMYIGAGALEHPLGDPSEIAQLFDLSTALRGCIDSYCTNIDGFGHRLEPIIDLEGDEADEKIADALWMRRANESDDDSVPMPTPEEVAAEKDRLRLAMRRERLRIEAFIQYACLDYSFITLRKQTRLESELLGNAFWEIERDKNGYPVELHHLQSISMRLLPLDSDFVSVEEKVKISDIDYGTVRRRRHFRRFMQVVGTDKVFFKEFGDPRVLGRLSGKFVTEFDEQIVDGKTVRTPHFEPGDEAASEVVHFVVYSPSGPVGMPRWAGGKLQVIGLRESQEVNRDYFENKAVPPLAIAVSGGHFGDDSVTALKDHFENKIKGKKNFHKVLLLEAESAQNPSDGGPSRTRIQFFPLTDAQLKDAIFGQYDVRCTDTIGFMFRLPRLLRGDIEDVNRSCYSSDTETLTEHGWKLHTEIGPDEKIAAFDPETEQVRFVVPEAKHVYDVDEEMWHFENAHTDCMVTPDHKMLVRSAQTTAKAATWEAFEASKIPYQRFEVLLAGKDWEGPELDWFDLPKDDGCKIERSHDHTTRVRGDDWLEFLGYFISEGCTLRTDNEHAPYLVCIGQKKPVTRDKIKACLDRLGWKYATQVKPCGTTDFRFHNRCLRKWLVENCGTHSHDKRIPWDYLNLSRRQLGILFQALMDGDGTVDRRENRTSCNYYTTSTILADQVQRLLVQVGMRAERRYSEGASCWRVMFSDHRTTRLYQTEQDRTPCSLTRQRYVGEVYCYSVPGYGFFVTRRNGKVAIQGNTADACLVFAEMQVFQGPRGEFDDWMNRKMFPAMGFRYWNFVSNGPIPRDSVAMAELIVKMATAGIITAEEAREFAADVFNKRLAKLVADWLKLPPPLALKNATSTSVPGAAPEPSVPPSAPPPEAAPGVPAAKSGTPLVLDDVQRVVALRDALLARERDEAAAAFAATQDTVHQPEQ